MIDQAADVVCAGGACVDKSCDAGVYACQVDREDRLLADDLAKPFAIKDGAIELPASAGLGIAPDPAALSRCARGPVREIGPA